MKARPLRRPTRTGRRDTRGARIATRKNPKSERRSRERHQTSLRASARSSLPAGRGPAGRRGTEGSPFCAVRTRNPILRCVARNRDSARRQPDTRSRSLPISLPANFGLREISPSEASATSLPSERLPGVRSPPSGEGRQGGVGQRDPGSARHAFRRPSGARRALEPLGLPRRDPPPLGYFGETNRAVTSAARP